jgi:hypothetical protein
MKNLFESIYDAISNFFLFGGQSLLIYKPK